jgi:acetolactate synthase small subunit
MSRHIVVATVRDPTNTLARMMSLFARHGVAVESLTTTPPPSPTVMTLVTQTSDNTTAALLRTRLHRLIDVEEVDVRSLPGCGTTCSPPAPRAPTPSIVHPAGG